MRDRNEGAYRGGEGTTPVTTACQKIAEGKTSYELSWKAKVMMKKTKQKTKHIPPFEGGENVVRVAMGWVIERFLPR